MKVLRREVPHDTRRTDTRHKNKTTGTSAHRASARDETFTCVHVKSLLCACVSALCVTVARSRSQARVVRVNVLGC